ncbi:MAG: succinate dehydrogenase, hydrophobic membrane anchor protein [Legionellales bacterium RIFCSPHIGHO2_12_FULL_35_11]|nr:MAG: succinate dehydrogenase, hydrophobic membrane anchor protein [Legionellales bacterium RIFCSPHIGHO2_12_FULL_35_11]
MLPNVTSLTGNGLKDWLIQRVSAVYLFFYLLFIFIFMVTNMPLDFYKWHDLFFLVSMQIATIIALFFVLLHAWIGLWTVTTDYINNTLIRIPVQAIIAIFLGGQFLWGIMIVWGQ